MKIIPLNDSVILKAKKETEVQTGGIFIPQTSDIRTDTFSVVAISDTLAEKELKIGDKVLCSPISGDEFKFNDEEYRIVSFDELQAKLVETDQIPD
ncbi:co-chaperone GroES [Myxococcota bacterium]|nr:co-chaperone GroES [Myxococcota bacterium]MBU1380014.1 co-chaperone GroES [Myxococcota bacterium]MBU1496045.1 co-chaperone GroES [Myxococcota bacterium]